MVNRAALAKPESYGWIHAAAGAYVVAVGGFSVAAWVADGEPFRAILCAGAQALAIVCAILARRGFTGEMPAMGWLMVVVSGACAFWAAVGIEHAWESNGQHVETGMVAFLAALEPILFLSAEHIKEGREALREKARRDDAELAAALEAARAKDRQWGPRLATAGGVAVATVAPAAESAVAAPPSAAHPPPVAAIVSTNTGHPTARAHAMALMRDSPWMSRRAIARQVGVHHSTVANWVRAAQAI